MVIKDIVIGTAYKINSNYEQDWPSVLNGKTFVPSKVLRVDVDEFGPHIVYEGKITSELSLEEIECLSDMHYVDPTVDNWEVQDDELEELEPLPTFLEVQNFGGDYGSIGVLNNDGKFLMQLEIFKDDEEPEYIQTQISEEFFRAFVKEFKK